MIQKCFFFVSLFFVSLTFGQNAKSKDYSKIKFVYEKVSNYHLDEKGIYADTLLLQQDLKKNKYEKVASPIDSQTILGFISYDKLSSKEKKKIASSIFHNAELISGEYDKNTNTTVLRVIRKDNDVFKKIKQYLKRNVDGVNSTIEINYATRQYTNSNGNSKTVKSFDEVGQKITYEGKSSGFYAFQNKNTGEEIKIAVDFKENLPAVVLPDMVLLNNTAGVNTVFSLQGIAYLKSVSYE